MSRADGRRTRGSGDDTEFETFYRLHEPRIRQFVHRRVRAAEVDDVVDAIFFTAWSHFDDLRTKPTQQLGWLFVTARHQLLNHFRGTRRQSRLAERLRFHGARPVQTNDVYPALLDGAVSDEHLVELLAKLSEGDRFILTLVAFDECTTAELAAALECSESAAKTRLSRARERFRRLAEIQHEKREGGDKQDERPV